MGFLVAVSSKRVTEILELYRIEYKAAEFGILGTADHLALRQKHAIPIMKKIDDWIKERKGIMAPQGATGKAITYAVNQWKSLSVFLTDPLIRLDNNLSENALRIIVWKPLREEGFLAVPTDPHLRGDDHSFIVIIYLKQTWSTIVFSSW